MSSLWETIYPSLDKSLPVLGPSLGESSPTNVEDFRFAMMRKRGQLIVKKW
jgi:hypothetical protein